MVGLEQCLQRDRIHVWVLTLRSLHGAHKSDQIRTPPEIVLTPKTGASKPVPRWRGRFTDPRNPLWHAAWSVLIQPLWTLDKGPSVAHRADQSRRTQTVPWVLDVHECAGLKSSLQFYCWLADAWLEILWLFLHTGTPPTSNMASVNRKISLFSLSVRKSRSLQKHRHRKAACLSAMIQQTLAKVSEWGHGEESCWQTGFLRKYPLYWLANHTALLWPEHCWMCKKKIGGSRGKKRRRRSCHTN